jgi:uncharacterized protein YacL (UPF0231 family)
MGAAQIKQELEIYIKNGDARLLNILYAVAKGYTEEDYTLPGNAMSLEVLKDRIQSAKNRLKIGHQTTQEELEKEVEQW